MSAGRWVPRLGVHTFIDMFVYPFIDLLIHLFIYLFIHSLNDLSIIFNHQLLVHSSVHSFSLVFII